MVEREEEELEADKVGGNPTKAGTNDAPHDSAPTGGLALGILG